jgi:hypothetical protein
VQANMELEKFDEAMRDAKRLISIDPKNKESIDIMQALNKLVLQKQTEQRSTKSQAKTMLELARDERGEKQKTALNNLIVLAKEDSGSNEILALKGLYILREVLNQDMNNEDNVLAIARIFSTLVKNSFKRVKNFNFIKLTVKFCFLHDFYVFFVRPKSFTMIYKLKLFLV